MPNSDFNLVVDAGGFSRGSDDASQLQNEYLLKAMMKLQYDAINMGAKEFQLKPSFIKKLSETMKLPLLSANVQMVGPAKAVWQPYLIKEINAQTSTRKIPIKKLKVAVLGLCDNKLSPLFIQRPDEPRMEYQEPIPIAQDLVPKLRQKAAVVILLYFGKQSELVKLMQNVPGIDVAVLGGEYYLASSGNSDKGTLMVTSTSQGKYADILTLQIGKDKRIAGSTSKHIALSESIAEDPKLGQLVKEFDKATIQSTPASH